jgi:hypothetical protein
MRALIVLAILPTAASFCACGSNDTSSYSSGDDADAGAGSSRSSASGGTSGSSGGAASDGSSSGAPNDGSSGGYGTSDASADGQVVDVTPPQDGGTGDGTVATTVTFNNGGFWNDTTGKKIQAHGGGFLKVGDTWYWFGEDKTMNMGGTGTFYGVSCYASKDLVTWEFRNSVVTRNTTSQLNVTNRVIERPKVIYNESTKQYVMWAHWDNTNYNDSQAVIFQSATVDGNYTYVKNFKPGGNDSRDCTLFKEDNGTAYFISVANTNADMMVYGLTSDYLDVQQVTAKIWAGQHREAPAIFKIQGTYYGVTSQSTGWAPNQGGYSTATSIGGPWSNIINIGDNTTFQSQSTYVIPVVGSQTTTYIYAGDRWNSSNLSLSQYVWVPLTVNGTMLSLTYYARWSLNLATGVWSPN